MVPICNHGNPKRLERILQMIEIRNFKSVSLISYLTLPSESVGTEKTPMKQQSIN